MLSFKKAKTWVVAISVIAVSLFLVVSVSNRVTMAAIDVPNGQTAASENPISVPVQRVEEPPTVTNNAWMDREIANAYAFVEAELARSYAFAENELERARNLVEQHGRSSDWLAERYQWAEDWIASRYEWADQWMNGGYVWFDGRYQWMPGRYEWAEYQAERIIELFEVYREFGLIYDPATDRLYFHGELVRYFEDMIPLPDFLGGTGATSAITHFTENGTVDVRVVRDFSVVVQLPNGATDHSGVIVGVEPFSQEEFDARDIFVEAELARNYALAENELERARNLAEQQNALMPVFPQDVPNAFSVNAPVPEFQPGQAPLMGTTEMPSNALVGSMTMAEMFADYEEFGITFSGNLLNGGTGNIYYNGRLVRTLIDATNGGVTSLSSSDRSGTINVRGIRDENGSLTSIDVVEI